jgi:hypothetical protein
MRNWRAGFARQVSVALLVWSAWTAFADERTPRNGSIFAADGRIPASVEEMLPAHTRRGVQASEWLRMNEIANASFVSGMSLQGHMSTELDESFADVYRRLEARDDLFPPEPSNNLFVRATDAIFRPAPISIGTTQLSFSPVTAWKKRNPLCLLNPLVLNWSW